MCTAYETVQSVDFMIVKMFHANCTYGMLHIYQVQEMGQFSHFKQGYGKGPSASSKLT